MNQHNFAGFLLGIGAGATLGLLFAPKSGTESRTLIAKKTKEQAGTMKKQAVDLWTSASHAVDDSHAALLRHTQGIKAAIEASTKAYKQAAG